MCRGWPLAVVLFLMEPFEVLLIQGLFLRGRGGRVPDYQLVDQCISNVFIYLSGSTPKSTTRGAKSKPPELSQDNIEVAKKEWENMVLSEGEEEM